MISKEENNRIVNTLFAAGLVLAGLEIFKQIYLRVTVGGSYDWWYFPFQLCSVPMYLCLLLPLVKGRLRSAFLTFMGGYTFVSAAAALAYPEDMLQAAPVLTAHGFIWHGILLFISILILRAGAADTSARGLISAAALFLAMCPVAIGINVLAEPLMQAGSAAHSYAAMFYLNPYHISPQPIISDIQKTAGIPAGLLIYIAAIIIASGLVLIISKSLTKRGRF